MENCLDGSLKLKILSPFTQTHIYIYTVHISVSVFNFYTENVKVDQQVASNWLKCDVYKCDTIQFAVLAGMIFFFNATTMWSKIQVTPHLFHLDCSPI